jgi:UPF0042 nucleotide-binding protein
MSEAPTFHHAAAPPGSRAAVRLVLVTGLSGAGRTTAIGALEDLGCETVDNLPLGLVPRLLDGPPLARPLAVGLAAASRDFSAAGLIELIDRLTLDPRIEVEVIYLDCAPDVLIRRYSQTRRRHPMALAEDPRAGIVREADLLAPVRVRADVLIDTSEMSPHDLKAELARWCGAAPQQRMAVSVQSFSYKRGLPRGVDMVFDCRFLRNPYWEARLRARDGRAPEVAAHVEGDPRFRPFFDRVVDLILTLLPAQIEEGKAHLSIGFGCTGGQHRSVAVAEKLADALAAAGWQVSIRHRELERRGPEATQADAG